MRSRLRDFPLSSDPESITYVEPDTWLIDYQSRIELWRRYADSVIVHDYDEVTARDGSVIPSFAAALGISAAGLPDYVLNSRESIHEKVQALMRGEDTGA